MNQNIEIGRACLSDVGAEPRDLGYRAAKKALDMVSCPISLILVLLSDEYILGGKSNETIRYFS